MKVDSSLCLSSVQVSSSTPVATKPETEVAEDEDEPIAKLHLSGYFPSLEDRLPSTLMDLIYWRQPLISCAVFSTLFVLLLSFSLFSFISVTAYVSLMVLCATMSYVLFKKIAAAVQKTGEGRLRWIFFVANRRSAMGSLIRMK